MSQKNTQKMSITEALTVVKVDLWGHTYKSKLVTRSGYKALQAIQQELRELDENGIDESELEEDVTAEQKADDEAVRLLGRQMALLVEPLDDDAPDVEDLVAEKWEEDELNLANLFRISFGLAEAQSPFAIR